MSDPQETLIEEARSYAKNAWKDVTRDVFTRLADALEAEIAAHSALRDKVKALAEEWDRDAANPEFNPTTRVLSEHHAERLRALVEEPQGGEGQ